MKRIDNSVYSIPVKGLSVGKHQFSFEVGNEFFAGYGGDEVTGAELSVVVDVVKNSTMMNIDGVITGNVSVECDRCLDELQLPIDTEFNLVVKLAKGIDEEDDDIMIVDQSEGELELDQLFYDTVILSLPLQRVHNEGGCDPEMISKLESLKGNTDEDEESSSPFSILKKLKN